MSEFLFGIIHTRPSLKTRDRWDRICKNEGGSGYTEVNRTNGSVPGVNNGRYQGWFVAPNRGEPFDGDLARRVLSRI